MEVQILSSAHEQSDCADEVCNLSCIREDLKGGAMFRKLAEQRAGVAEMSNDGETLYVTKSSLPRTKTTLEGVCVIECGRVAIQRKLVYLSNLFCQKVIGLTRGS